MKNYKNYVDDLKRQKTELVTALNVKGVEATNDETFNTLVPKVETITTGKPEQEKTVSITHSGSTIVTPDSGKVLSKVTAQVTDGTMTNNISVDNSGLITVNTQITGGYIATNARQATKQLTTQSAKTITPTTSDQTAVTSGKYTTGAITVKGDSNLKAENIKKDVSIFGVTGSLESGGSGGGTGETTTIAFYNASSSKYELPICVMYQTANNEYKFNNDFDSTEDFSIPNVLIGGIIFMYTNIFSTLSIYSEYSQNVKQIDVGYTGSLEEGQFLSIWKITGKNAVIPYILQNFS